jgi:hypothetical protein
VIARPFAASNAAIDRGDDQMVGNGRAQQKMVDAQSGIAGKAFRKYFQKV